MPSLINDYVINGHVTEINQSDCDTSRSRRDFPIFSCVKPKLLVKSLNKIPL